MIELTNRQARQFLLLKHGLLGEYQFTGKQGVLDFVRQVGCIQFDPIDVCGKNAELVLQSRIKGFTKNLLDELLYKDRLLIDYPDKNLAIMPVEDWPYFERYRQAARQHAKRYPEMEALTEQVRVHIQNHGAICSDDLKLDGNFSWRSAIHWSGGNNTSRSVLEQMYSTGELVIHHKKGTRKYYDIAGKYIQPNLLNASEPLKDELEHHKWRVLRRIGAVGLLWNRASDAWLSIWGLKAEQRKEVFRQLLDEARIVAIAVDQVKDTLYCRVEDLPLIEAVLQNPEPKFRCELIAPLDNLMWDRRLINALFGFDYTWEIYTPANKRKFGYYVLPLLYGESLIGRAEVIAERKTGTLVVKNIWYENGIRLTKQLRTALNRCFQKFALFNGCETISAESMD
ncbi:winged helix DNA-binding domain-containing protein [Paenibacillus sp. alder61]|uniref:Winged helix-turn-helix domain-containing protein n=1 Tax=Paenibacillus faecis TaxID=862114 RepID=A0A5D0CR88_9BACL|nr:MULTISPECIES: crosslink repair DNA glycosylase YcaQ family protein [Paenibacillus]MCA1293266.1 winged helix DNA-binding domain-containing protein [Paenibacillus sp. alder61]TYA12333.1 winged helix-turn-helix domain-containing protein [Paenibacillus faecis]